MFSYINMQIVLVYFSIIDMWIYVCIQIYLYVDLTLLCGGNKEYLSIKFIKFDEKCKALHLDIFFQSFI